ncbi:MAG: hypothetical protein AAGH15_23500, partial [Myxococcota bacterium]
MRGIHGGGLGSRARVLLALLFLAACSGDDPSMEAPEASFASARDFLFRIVEHDPRASRPVVTTVDADGHLERVFFRTAHDEERPTWHRVQLALSVDELEGLHEVLAEPAFWALPARCAGADDRVRAHALYAVRVHGRTKEIDCGTRRPAP